MTLDELATAAHIIAPHYGRPVARGTYSVMSAAQARAIIEAGGASGWIRRGTGHGALTTTQITSLAKRGYGTPTTTMEGRREIITGLTISPAGASTAKNIMEEK